MPRLRAERADTGPCRRSLRRNRGSPGQLRGTHGLRWGWGSAPRDGLTAWCSDSRGPEASGLGVRAPGCWAGREGGDRDVLTLPGGGQGRQPARAFLTPGARGGWKFRGRGSLLWLPVFWSDVVALCPAQIDARTSYLCPVTELPPTSLPVLQAQPSPWSVVRPPLVHGGGWECSQLSPCDPSLRARQELGGICADGDWPSAPSCRRRAGWRDWAHCLTRELSPLPALADQWLFVFGVKLNLGNVQLT